MLSQFPTLPPLPVADSEDAVILQNTYSRLQHTLLSAVDGQMDTLEQALREAQNDIKMTAEEKQTIAVELARVQKQVGGMNEGLARNVRSPDSSTLTSLFKQRSRTRRDPYKTARRNYRI
ncbi:hypothetical protein BC832DRAFT_460344 [Gaertneriomyces semiglobifer]|nr:hypothetical protein BC832DRAFT_460344 [Gaertneriomyces semiglobifer]